jgi:hypothetical protein
MSTAPAERSSAARTRRHRERRRRGMRCVKVDVSQGELDALVARDYLSEGQRDNSKASTEILLLEATNKSAVRRRQ